jgi:hypothetical protein
MKTCARRRPCSAAMGESRPPTASISGERSHGGRRGSTPFSMDVQDVAPAAERLGHKESDSIGSAAADLGVSVTDLGGAAKSSAAR